MTDTMLVTGAAGFIGGHLCRHLLARGHPVVGVDNFDPFYPPARKRDTAADLCAHPAFRLIEGDVRSPDVLDAALDGVNAVVHLAARGGVRRSFREAAAYAAINVAGTAAVLTACARRDCRRVVYASSSSVYGDGTPLPFAEGGPPGPPRSPYAVTKRAGEEFCSVWSRSADMRVAMVRLFSVYGPGLRPDLAVYRFTEALSAGRPVTLFGDGSAARDLTWIDDAVRGLSAALEWTSAGPAMARAFNIGGGRAIRMDRVAALLAETLGTSAPARRAAPHPGDMPRTAASLVRARHELGYEPTVVPEAGLPRFVQWYEARYGRQSRTTA